MDNDLINELRDKAEVEGAGSTRRLLELAARELERLKEQKSEWLEDSDPGQEYGTTWACRECGHSLHEQHVWNPYDCGWRYCPWCGRQMVRNLDDETESRNYNPSKCGGMGSPSCETCDMVCPYR